jgi:hypothetical protein
LLRLPSFAELELIDREGAELLAAGALEPDPAGKNVIRQEFIRLPGYEEVRPSFLLAGLAAEDRDVLAGALEAPKASCAELELLDRMGRQTGGSVVRFVEVRSGSNTHYEVSAVFYGAGDGVAASRGPTATRDANHERPAV